MHMTETPSSKHNYICYYFLAQHFICLGLKLFGFLNFWWASSSVYNIYKYMSIREWWRRQWAQLYIVTVMLLSTTEVWRSGEQSQPGCHQHVWVDSVEQTEGIKPTGQRHSPTMCVCFCTCRSHPVSLSVSLSVCLPPSMQDERWPMLELDGSVQVCPTMSVLTVVQLGVDAGPGPQSSLGWSSHWHLPSVRQSWPCMHAVKPPQPELIMCR